MAGGGGASGWRCMPAASGSPARVLAGDFRVGPVPTVHYVPGYVAEEEERGLLESLSSGKRRWTQARLFG